MKVNTALSPPYSRDMETIAMRLEEKYGFVSNFAQVLAHAPGALSSWLDIEEYCRTQSHLTERQRMLIILVAVRDVQYCWPHYRPLANIVGFSDDQISLIRQGRVPQDINDVEQIVCRISNEIVACRQIPQTLHEDVWQLLMPRQIVDIAILASFYLAIAALSTGLSIQIEAVEVLRREQAHYKKVIGLA